MLRCRKGSVAIEFALIAPFLILLIGAICETGAFLFTQYRLQLATTDAARMLQTNQITTANQFRTEVCARFNIANCATAIHIDVRSAARFNLLTRREIVDVDNDIFDPVNPGQATSVIVTWDWTFIFPFMGDFSRLFNAGWQAGVGFANVPNRTDIRRLHGISVFMTEMR